MLLKASRSLYHCPTVGYPETGHKWLLGSPVDAECMVGEPSLVINCDFPGTETHSCLQNSRDRFRCRSSTTPLFENGDSLIMRILLTNNRVLQSRRCHKPDATDDFIRRRSGKERGF